MKTIKNLVILIVGVCVGMIAMLVILNFEVEVTPIYDHIETSVNGNVIRSYDKMSEVDYDIYWDGENILTF